MSHLSDLREALQAHLPSETDGDSLGVLTGFVVVAQWSAPDGDIWLTKTAGDINDEGPPIWTVKGWLFHALDTAQRDADEAREDQDDDTPDDD